MKKNLRIVSAAAAALLAVAPVAASAVNVNATVDYGTTTTSQPVSQNTVGVNINLGDIVGKKVSDVVNPSTGKLTADALKKVTISFKTSDGTNAALIGNVTDYDITLQPTTGSWDANAKIGAGQYTVSVANLKIGGLINNKDYSAANAGEFNGSANTKLLGSTLNTTGVNYGETFRIFDKNAKGNPYFTNAKTNVQIADKGTVSQTVKTSGLTTPQSVLEAAANTVDTVDTGLTYGSTANAKQKGIITTADEVKKELSDQKALLSNGNVDTSKAFHITLTAQNVNNGKTVSVKVNFTAAPEYANLPIIYMTSNSAEGGVNGNDDKAFGKLSGTPLVEGRSNVTTAIAGGKDAIAVKQGNQTFDKVPFITFDASKGSQFKPSDYFKAATNDNKAWTNTFQVEKNTVDSSKAGVYSVTVSASNSKGKTEFTVPVVVVKGQAKVDTIKNTPGYPVTVYEILNGQAVKSANNYDFLYNDHPVKTYETKTIDGKSYTRIQDTEQTALASANNAWVESDKLSNYKPATEESVSTRIMYRSAVYNSKMENTHQTIAGYDYADLVAGKDGSPKEYNLNGNKMYKIANKDQYVRARNVTGSKMTLKHNSYVYKSNGKRANKKVLKKGRTITVYGGSYKAIKKYKGKAVRIGVNRYVKLANVNYKLY